MPFAPTPRIFRAPPASTRHRRADVDSPCCAHSCVTVASMPRAKWCCSTLAAVRATVPDRPMRPPNDAPPRMTIAILDPFSGISGDMTLGALIDVGLDPAWLEALPRALGLEGVGVRIRDVRRGEIACKKVDFDIPPQPHGRGIREIRDIVARSEAPVRVRALADEAFTAIATCEGAIHGMPPEEVHLHEVGAVDAILDVVGAIWGF